MSIQRGWIVVLASAGAAFAQKLPPTTQPPTGVVMGTVTCADTQRPARFVQISLVRRPTADDLNAPPTGNPMRLDPKGPALVGVLNGRSGLDGRYAIGGIPPGDYWILARLAGYVLPVGRVPDEKAAKDVDTVMSSVPLVHVDGDRTSTANVSMQRGGVISGRMQFEDGTPVVGMSIMVQPTEGGNATYVMQPRYLAGALGYTRDTAFTDDDGRFRVAGVAPGKYVVSAIVDVDNGFRMNTDGTLPQGQKSFTLPLTAYAPGEFRKRDAKVYEIAGADQVTDANLELALDHLHSVRGRVLVTDAGLPPDHVLMRLVDATDKPFERRSSVAPDGSFHFDFLPAGTFTVTAESGEDYADPSDRSAKGQKVVRRYGELKASVIVGDRDVSMEDLLLDAMEPKSGETP